MKGGARLWLKPHILRTGVWMLACAWAAPAAVAGESAASDLAAVLRQIPDPERGRRLYEPCADCHGVRGEGAADLAAPAIAGQHYRVVARQLVEFRNDERRNIWMEHFSDRHRLRGPQEIADLAHYVSRLQAASHPGKATPQLLERGATIYSEHCRRCHGADGRGDDERMVPSLAGQYPDYLPGQFSAARSGRRPGMEEAHVRLFETLGSGDIRAAAEYLSALPP